MSNPRVIDRPILCKHCHNNGESAGEKCQTCMGYGALTVSRVKKLGHMTWLVKKTALETILERPKMPMLYLKCWNRGVPKSAVKVGPFWQIFFVHSTIIGDVKEIGFLNPAGLWNVFNAKGRNKLFTSVSIYDEAVGERLYGQKT